MFKINAGDFPEYSSFAKGKIIWGFGSKNQEDLHGKIIEIEKLETQNKKQVVATCKLVDGRKFIVTCDNNTYQQLENMKVTENESKVFEQKIDNKEKKSRGGVIKFLVLIGIISAGLYMFFGENSTGNDTKYLSDLELKQEQEEKIINEIKKAGVEKIKEFKHDEMLDGEKQGQKGYRVSGDDISNIIVYINADGGLDSIRYNNIDMYKDGKNIDSIKNYTLSISEKTDLQLEIEKNVKSILKSPSTAKFPFISDWIFDKNKERIVVQSYVDSQNSFGAMIRAEFQVIVSSDGKTFKSFIFDGEELIKNK